MAIRTRQHHGDGRGTPTGITVAVFRIVAALQLSVTCGLRDRGYIGSPLFGWRGSGGEGCEAGAVVVPAGACLVDAAPA